LVITPSHNPPEDGGIKYNPPHGGPADETTTKLIEERANELLSKGLKGVKRILYEKAIKTEFIKEYDYIYPYVEDLKNIIDMEIIAKADLKIGGRIRLAVPQSISGIPLLSTIAWHSKSLMIELILRFPS